MFNIGAPELMIIMALALIVFGPRKLPEIGRSIGNAMKEFRRASSEFMDAVHNPSYEEEHRAPVKSVEYPTTPALDSPENYETLPYGSDFYSPPAEPEATPSPLHAAANGEEDWTNGASAAGDPALDETTAPGPAGTAAGTAETLSERKV